MQPAEQAKTVAELEKARTGSKLHVENRFGPSGCFTRAQAAFGTENCDCDRKADWTPKENIFLIVQPIAIEPQSDT